MIQRPQTIFQALAAICGLFMFFTAISLFVIGPNIYNFSIFGLHLISGKGLAHQPTYGLMVLNAAVSALSVFILFQYKNRRIQIQLGRFNLLLWTGFASAVYLTHSSMKKLALTLHEVDKADVHIGYQLGVLLPILGIIFQIVSLLLTKRDEAIVRSADRIR
jgi:hypothetical protein